jgi:CBS domain-containing protein
LKVSDLPPGRLHSVDPRTTLAEVAKAMRTADADSIAVMSGSNLVGIITERDLVRAIADGMDPKRVSADVIMSADPATVGEDEEIGVVAVKMMTLGIRHLPVVNRDGEPVGLLSARDLVAMLDQGRA